MPPFGKPVTRRIWATRSPGTAIDGARLMTGSLPDQILVRGSPSTTRSSPGRFGQLGVAEPGNFRTCLHGIDQFTVLVHVGGLILDRPIPKPVFSRWRLVTDSTKLGEHHWHPNLPIGKGDEPILRLDVPKRLIHPLRAAIPLEDCLSVERVVVDAKDVTYQILPAVIGDYGSGGIKGFGQVVETANEMLLRFVAQIGSERPNSH